MRVSVIFAAVLAVGVWIAAPLLLPRGGNPSPVGELVREAGPELTPGTRVAMVDFREPNAVWETRRIVLAPLDEISEADAAAYLREAGPRAVIVSSKTLGRISVDPAWRIYRARGFNAARLTGLDLALVVKGSR